MTTKPVALVTGANKGIGLQIAKDLVGHGFTVLVGARQLGQGTAAAKDIGADAHAIQLDVTDQTSVAAAADSIAKDHGHLDVLVNNAGISHAGTPGRKLEDVVVATRIGTVALDELKTIFDTNVFGVVAVTQAMLPLLRKAPQPRVVMVSSGVASLTNLAEPGSRYRAISGAYSASKTALNGVTLALAAELESEGIKVNMACPGYTATDLNAFSGHRTVEQGAREPVRLALIGADGPTGSYSNDDGPIPW